MSTTHKLQVMIQVKKDCSPLITLKLTQAIFVIQVKFKLNILVSYLEYYFKELSYIGIHEYQNIFQKFKFSRILDKYI